MSLRNTHKGVEYTLFFVLNGLVNGEEGVTATKSGSSHGTILKDGWYFLEGDDVDGDGPYDSKDEARKYATVHINSDIECRAIDEFEELIDRLKKNGLEPDSIRECFEEAMR